MAGTRYWRCFIGFLARFEPGTVVLLLIAAVSIWCLVGAIILRAAVALANMMLCGPGGEGDHYVEALESSGMPDPSNPYGITVDGRSTGCASGGDEILGPTFLQAIVMLLVTTVVLAVVRFGAEFVLSGLLPWVVKLVSSLLGLGVNVGILKAMLPTTAARALLVWVLSSAIVLGLLALIVGVLLAVGVAL